MKPREPRLTCVVKARMRLGGVWSDACIRNISSRGMLIRAASAPPRGTYLELYRGRHVIVARVAWCEGKSFGIQTQDRVDVAAVLNEPNLSSVDYKDKLKVQPTFERRSAPRLSQADLRWSAERNRFVSKALEFACLGAMGALGAAMVSETVSGTLSEPLAAVTAKLLEEGR